MKFSALTRVYVQQILKEKEFVTLDTELFHYFKNVLRLQKGSKIRVFNESQGEFEACITDFGKQSVIIEVGEILRAIKKVPPLNLGLCLIKQEKMLDAIDMATQLGVTDITLLISDYSQKNINLPKLKKRIIQASEQSERLTLPVIKGSKALKEFYKEYEQIIYAHEKEIEEKTILNIGLLKESVALLIGPEGGFSQNEKNMLRSWPNACSFSLGYEVLRSETAVAAGLAQLKLVK